MTTNTTGSQKHGSPTTVATQEELIKSLLSVVYSNYRDAAAKDLQTILAMERKAAAPDLLASLDDLLGRADRLIFRPALDDSRRIDQDTRALRAGLEQARAAIAKAKGEA